MHREENELRRPGENVRACVHVRADEQNTEKNNKKKTEDEEVPRRAVQEDGRCKQKNIYILESGEYTEEEAKE